MVIIKYLANHHSGGIANDVYAKSQYLTWQNIDQAHKDRWNFVSTLGLYGGYNFYIQSDGSYKQFRLIGEETAAQFSHNLDTISICLAGNFKERNGIRIEQPTEAQISTLKRLENKILRNDFSGLYVAPNTVVEIKKENIHPHNFYQTTECNCFPDDWGRKLIDEGSSASPRQTVILGLIDSILLLIAKLRVELASLFAEKKVGSIDRACNGRV